MTQTRRRARAAVSVIAILTTVLSSGCATNGLSSLPLPAPGLSSSGYTLTAVFANALNLPMNAKVKLAGADVGQLESMVARNYSAVTTLRIRDGVSLPLGSTAELRTATPLGDVFVSLRPPAHVDLGTPLLKNGDTIGLQSTTAAATVESVLSSAAVLVNGGAIRNFTNIINGFGKATGDHGEALGELIGKSNRLLGTLDARSGQFSDALSQLSRLSHSIDTKNRAIAQLMAASQPATSTLADNATQISDLAVQIGDTSRLLAKFPSIGGTKVSGRSMIRDLNAVAKSLNDVAVSPDTSWYALNRLIAPVIKAFAGNGVSVDASLDELVLGALPDSGFPGDKGLHGPSRYTWNELVGSLKYTFWRLQERIVGRGPNSPQVPVIPDPIVPGQIDRAPAPGTQPTGPQR